MPDAIQSKGNTSNLGPSTARATFALESIKPFCILITTTVATAMSWCWVDRTLIFKSR
jgi:hypothetical protein